MTLLAFAFSSQMPVQAQNGPIRRIGQRIATNIQNRQEIRDQASVDTNSVVVPIGRISGRRVSTAPTSYAEVPIEATNYDRRIRIIDPYGDRFYNRYYENGKFDYWNYLGDSNTRAQVVSDVDRTLRRRNWDTNNQGNNKVGRSGGSGNGGMTVSQSQNVFNMFQAQSLSRINAMNQSRSSGVSSPTSSGSYNPGGKLFMLDNR
jgi:hypothetical protein